MQLHLFLLYSLSHYQFLVLARAYWTKDDNDFSPVRTDLYQCATQKTFLANHPEPIVDSSMSPCNYSCCTTHHNYNTSTDQCQVSVQTSGGACLGRLCYLGSCENYSRLANLTRDEKMLNSTSMINTLRSSFAYIPWSSLMNRTQTKWRSWIDQTGFTLRRSALIILSVLNLLLTSITLVAVFKSIKHANVMAGKKSYRYTLL